MKRLNIIVPLSLLVFICLKLMHVIDWSWIWVTSPFWITAIIYVLLYRFIKRLLPVVAFLLLATSCSTFFISGSEVFTDMYVRDSKGCSFTRAIVSTTRLSKIGDDRLSFYIETGHHKITIPSMEMNYGHANYTGKGLDGKTYTVTYLLNSKNTTIKVERTGTRITVSTDNICVSKPRIKKTEW